MKKIKFHVRILGLGFTTSCDKEKDINPSIDNNVQIESEKGRIELGKKLQNPYSVSNMTQAQKNLSARIGSDELIIKTTHYYVKFSPKNEEELNILKQDSTIVLYTYPLDYEIINEGHFYHDPELGQDQPTYRYCSIEQNHPIPKGVNYEILEELFIPDEVGLSDNNARLASDNYIDLLVNEAFEITDNLDETNTNQTSRIEESEWQPAGRVRVWDNFIHQWSNIEGVEVRARRWFTTHKGITDANGIFFCDGKFKGEANHSIDWETYHFSIRSGAVGQACFNGPKMKGIWFCDINEGSIQQYYATIFQGAHFYYYKDILGLKRPPLNGFWKSQMKIGLFDGDGRASHNDDRRYAGIRNQIKMYKQNEDGSFRNSQRNYTTTLHELAHASHWELRKGKWDFDTEDKLQESWACGVTWALGRLKYPTYNNIANVTFESIVSKGERKYTPVIIDLIDNDNQGEFDSKKPFDRVSGYTIKEIDQHYTIPKI